MTIVVTAKVSDGIVLAADSAGSFFGGGPTPIKIYNNANKIFNLRKVWPIGAMVYGSRGRRPLRDRTLRRSLIEIVAGSHGPIFLCSSLTGRAPRRFHRDRFGTNHGVATVVTPLPSQIEAASTSVTRRRQRGKGGLFVRWLAHNWDAVWRRARCTAASESLRVCFGECAVAIVTGKPVRNASAVGTPLSIFGLLYRSWRSAVDTVRCGKSRRVDSILGASGRYHRGACGRVEQRSPSSAGTIPALRAGRSAICVTPLYAARE